MKHVRHSLGMVAVLSVLWMAPFLTGCDASMASLAELDGPTHAVRGPDGNIYVSDGYVNSRIAVFSPNGQLIESRGHRGWARGQFHNPHGLVFLRDGRLVVCDRDNGRLQVFDSAGAPLDIWQGPQIGRPWNAALLPNGNIVVLDGGDQNDAKPRSGIVILTPAGDVVRRFASYGASPGELAWAHSVAVDSSSRIYVVDLRNERLQRWFPSDSTYVVDTAWSQQTLAHVTKPVAVAVSGSDVFVSQDGAGLPIVVLSTESGTRLRDLASGLFERVHGISIDADNTFWITDVERNVVYHLDWNGNILQRVGSQE